MGICIETKIVYLLLADNDGCLLFIKFRKKDPTTLMMKKSSQYIQLKSFQKKNYAFLNLKHIICF